MYPFTSPRTIETKLQRSRDHHILAQANAGSRGILQGTRRRVDTG